MMESGHDGLPIRLDQLRDRRWLANFALGALYVDLRFGGHRFGS